MENQSSKSLYEQMMQMYEQQDNEAEGSTEKGAESGKEGANEEKTLSSNRIVSDTQQDIKLQRLNLFINKCRNSKETIAVDIDVAFSKLKKMKSDLRSSLLSIGLWILFWVLFLLLYRSIKQISDNPIFLLDALLVIVGLALIVLIKPMVLPVFKHNLTYRIYAADPKYSAFIEERKLSTYNRQREYCSICNGIVDKKIKGYMKVKKKIERNEELDENETEIVESDLLFRFPPYEFKDYKYDGFDYFRNLKLLIKK